MAGMPPWNPLSTLGGQRARPTVLWAAEGHPSVLAADNKAYQNIVGPCKPFYMELLVEQNRYHLTLKAHSLSDEKVVLDSGFRDDVEEIDQFEMLHVNDSKVTHIMYGVA